MKGNIIQSALIAAAMLLSAGLSPAADSNAVAPEDTKAISAPNAAERNAKAKNAKPKNAKAAAKAKLVDINSAGKKELMTLPGIGDAEADKIIAGRPFLTKAHLVTHNILPQGVYENLKTLVAARQKDGTPPKPAQK